MIRQPENIAIVGIFVLAGMNAGHGQQLATFSQFRNMQYTLNPAVVELFELDTDGDVLDVDIAYRAQWTNIDDSPRTATAGVQYAFTEQNMAVGAYVLHDRFGPTRYTHIGLQYAYQVKFDRYEYHFLSIGVAGVMNQFRLDFNELDVIEQNDLLLQADENTRLVPDINIGVYYQKKIGAYSPSGGTYLFAGLSADQLLHSDIEFISGANLKREAVMHLFGGVRTYYDNKGYDYIEPVFWVKSGLNTPIHADIGCKATFAENRFWLAGIFGSDFQVHLQAGFRLGSVSVGYSASFMLNTDIGAQSGMSHELVMGYVGIFR